MKKHMTINVHGRVQNVGFRYFTNKRAHEHNIHGFVKNQPDGTVYIEAEADEVDLNTFLDHVKRGPRWGRVDEVVVNEEPLMAYKGFEIR